MEYFDEEAGSADGCTDGGSKKYYDFVFTLNNYTQSSKNYIDNVFAGECEYLVYQHERGDSDTPHLQGYFRFKSRRSLRALVTRFARGPARGIHLEPRKGTIEQAIEYCTREEKRDILACAQVFESGNRPTGRGCRTDVRALINSVREGRTYAQLFDEHPEAMVRYARGVQLARMVYVRPRREKTIVKWFYGTTGTGKSRAASDEAGDDAYWKQGGSRWWDGYEGQTNVVIDDYRCDLCPFHQLLRLFDRYPLLLEVKGGSVHFISKVIYVTAPQRPEVMWRNRTGEDVAQLLRRIEEVRLFGEEPPLPQENENFNRNNN
jgi:hypothetical protein